MTKFLEKIIFHRLKFGISTGQKKLPIYQYFVFFNFMGSNYEEN